MGVARHHPSALRPAALEITSRRGDAVLMSRAEYDALQETAHLLRVPANVRYLLESGSSDLNGVCLHGFGTKALQA